MGVIKKGESYAVYEKDSLKIVKHGLKRESAKAPADSKPKYNYASGSWLADKRKEKGIKEDASELDENVSNAVQRVIKTISEFDAEGVELFLNNLSMYFGRSDSNDDFKLLAKNLEKCRIDWGKREGN